MTKIDNWYQAKVIPGKKIATTLGYPTINLDNPLLLKGKKEGVYACSVKIGDSVYDGVLYYGPRLILNEKEEIIEIFILDFRGNLYNKKILFQIHDFIRPPQSFPNFAEFKNQLTLDCQIARKILK